MNKSLIYGIFAAIFLFGTYFFLTRIISESSSAIYFAGLGLGILAGIFAFFKGIGEIKRNENKLQAVIGTVLGFVTGVLPSVALLIMIAMLLIGGPH